ncbi:zinc finger protein 830-like [Zophobas morio]|uniref:zinc finger protein 830-like n=1 Tax=Zophobas morio TaxID=2755281 RepID=UPI003083D001
MTFRLPPESKSRLANKNFEHPATKGKLQSPFAVHNEEGKLFCKLCDVPLKNETVWNAHLRGKTHKNNLETFYKSSEPSEKALDHNFGKKTDEYPTTHLAKRVKSDIEKDENNLPRNFFNNTIEENSDNKSSIPEALDENNSISSNLTDFLDPEDYKELEKGKLPKGFFDTSVKAPKKPAKVKGSSIDDEVESFDKEIESMEKQALEDIEKEETKLTIDRIDEELRIQMTCLSRVEEIAHLQKMRKEKLNARQEKLASPVDFKKLPSATFEDETERESNYSDDLNWRSKEI